MKRGVGRGEVPRARLVEAGNVFVSLSEHRLKPSSKGRGNLAIPEPSRVGRFDEAAKIIIDVDRRGAYRGRRLLRCVKKIVGNPPNGLHEQLAAILRGDCARVCFKRPRDSDILCNHHEVTGKIPLDKPTDARAKNGRFVGR